MRCPNGRRISFAKYRKAIKETRMWTGRGNLSVQELQWTDVYMRKNVKGEGNHCMRVNQELTKMHQEAD